MNVDSLVAALGDALVGAGFERPRPPRDFAWLDEINATVAPLRLPEQLARFWQLVDPATLRAAVSPQFTNPRFALDHWRMQREDFPYYEPHNLLLVGYESWNCMWIELDDHSGRGGTLFDGRLDADVFFRRYNSLADWLARILELIAAGSVEEWGSADNPYQRILDPHDDRPVTAPGELPPSLVYGDQIEIGRATLRWPAHWQHASGIDPADAETRGATHTIADILGSDPAHELCATVAGWVDSLAGSDHVTRVRVSDGTAAIDISCDSQTMPFGLAIGEQFEFDIVIAAGERQIPADVEAARSSTDDPHEQLTRVLLARHGGPVGAVATAVRPLASAR